MQTKSKKDMIYLVLAFKAVYRPTSVDTNSVKDQLVIVWQHSESEIINYKTVPICKFQFVLYFFHFLLIGIFVPRRLPGKYWNSYTFWFLQFWHIFFSVRLSSRLFIFHSLFFLIVLLCLWFFSFSAKWEKWDIACTVWMLYMLRICI